MMQRLFFPSEQGIPRVSSSWFLTRDGDPSVVDLYRRHYSCKDPGKKLLGRNFARIKPGGGESMILITGHGDAILGWHKSGDRMRLDGQVGLYCFVFRNEGSTRSSDLIVEASEAAWERWGPIRCFTFVNPDRIRSSNPGYCFQMAG